MAVFYARMRRFLPIRDLDGLHAQTEQAIPLMFMLEVRKETAG